MRLTPAIRFETQTRKNAHRFEMQLLINPLSPTTQKLLPLVRFLHETFPSKIAIFLHPAEDETSIPLKQFYRWALPKIEFSEDQLVNIQSPRATFESLPETTLLTMNPVTPSAWLIEPSVAELDLDNLRMISFPSETMTVIYRLESLLVTGSCYDTTARTRKDIHPRGLQLTLGRTCFGFRFERFLGKNVQSVEMDTLVMSNLGYFQLKANPGTWVLSLAEGRTKELYYIDPERASDFGKPLGSTTDPTSFSFVMDSFSGRYLVLRVHKRAGHEDEDVLDTPEFKSTSILDNLRRIVGFGENDGNSHSKENKNVTNWHNCQFPDDPVNIFTVASGHMYERLQKIMILSVLRNTRSCVKFWFIKNYMSPQIKAVLPHFAKTYKFEFELITYKWPTWLHAQTEKQRIIWAYKILFLDVLFPLNVRKVIFLDSDQIIRTDIRQLYDLDIQGAPLAYTPFCNNNKEMDGYRFWTKGFWKEHLKGKPYHISALYVVDLIKFRQMAAGDHLRVIYEQLSKDPNSLSNLDQDLPNYTQHEVPIFSLPQEWLWCESWCGNETRHKAKTIDLCNNPMTKEPKLQSAKRIVSEWIELDTEASRMVESFDPPKIETPKNGQRDATEL